MPIAVECACGKAFEAADELAGKLVRCPGCGLPVEVTGRHVPPPKPEPKSKAKILETPVAVTEPVEVPCACGRRFTAPPHFVGKMVRCPGCGLPVEVTGPEVIPEVEDIEVVEEEDEEPGGIFKLKEEELPLAPTLGDATALKGTLGQIPFGEPASALALSAASRWSLAAQGDSIHVLDMKNFKKLFRFREHDAPVTCVAISLDTRFALSADKRGRLYYWRIDNGDVVQELAGHRSSIRALAFSPDGRRAVSGGANGVLMLWDLSSGEEMELDGGPGEPTIRAVAFSPDGKQVLAGGDEGHVTLWNARSGKRLYRLKGTDDDIESVAFAEGGALAAAAALTRRRPGVIAYQWTLHNGKRVPTFTLPSEKISEPTCVHLTPSGHRLLVGSHKWERVLVGPMDEEVYQNVQFFCLEIWSIDAGRRLQSYDDVGAPIERLTVSPESARALGSLTAGWLSLWGLPY